MFSSRKDKTQLISEDEALPGHDHRLFSVPAQHFVNFKPLEPPFPDGLEQAIFGLGCFWGAERKFWEIEGVFTTAVGYAGGHSPIRRTKRCAADARGTPRPCSSCSTPRRSRTSNC